MIPLRKHIERLDNMLAAVPSFFHASGPAVLAANLHLSHLPHSTSSNSTPSTNFKIPPMPDELDHDDYIDVPFWSRGDWSRHESREKDGGKELNKLGFLTNESGDPPSSTHLREFWRTAKAAWIGLYQEHLDPESWGKKTPLAANYFYSTMKNAFPKFRSARTTGRPTNMQRTSSQIGKQILATPGS